MNYLLGSLDMSNNASNLSFDIKNRLIYIKRLFTIGIEHESLGTEMDRLVAVLHYDASIEHLLNIILSFFEITSKKEKLEIFSKLWDTVNEELEKNKDEIGKFKLPNRREVEQLHNVRNQAQHFGIIPDAKFVQRFRGTTEKFMKDVISNVFKIDYLEITSALLIQNEDIKKIIEYSEKSFTDHEFEKSMKLLSIAFEMAKLDEQQRIFGSGSLIFKEACKGLPTFEKQMKGYHDKKIFGNLIDYISEFDILILDEIEILKLRLDYKKYMHFKRISPEVNFQNDDISKEPEITEPRTKCYDYDNALFCLNFVIDSIIIWESFKSPTYIEYYSDYMPS
jgi:hypothetical protein